jgi:hypothetical protein
VASAAVLCLSTLIPVDRSTRWNTQLLPFDDHLGVLISYLHGGPKVHLSKLEWPGSP